MNNPLKVSVILPIFNGESTLAATLDSLVAQTYQDFEVVACIDGSTDASLHILNEYIGKFKSLKILINGHNLGLGPTMNRLLANVEGQYVAVAEQDDYYYPNRLKLQVEVLDNRPEIGMVSGIAEFWDGEKTTGLFPGILVHGGQYPKGAEMFLLNYRRQIKVVNSCMMFRKIIHVEKGLYFTKHYPSVGVDWAYVLRFSLVSNIYGLNEVLVRLDRRQNRDSVTTKKERMFKASRELIRAFAYEYPDIIMKVDYKYALREQYALEMNQLGGLNFVYKALYYSFRFLGDKRFFTSLMARLRKKIRH